MSSDLVIVYHRQPYEEVEVDGVVEYRENASPNGIVPHVSSPRPSLLKCAKPRRATPKFVDHAQHLSYRV